METSEKAFESNIQTVVTSHTDEEGYALAFTNAAGQSADDLIEKTKTYWNKYLRKQQSFELRISGNLFLPRFIAFKQRLDEIQDVEAVLQKEAATNSAILEIAYKGRTDQFANAVMLKTFDSFGVDIVDVTEDSIEIRLVDKGQAQ